MIFSLQGDIPLGSRLGLDTSDSSQRLLHTLLIKHRDDLLIKQVIPPPSEFRNLHFSRVSVFRLFLDSDVDVPE